MKILNYNSRRPAMKRKRNILSLLLVIAMVVSLNNSVSKNSVFAMETESQVNKVFDLQESACRAHECLMMRIDPKDCCAFPADSHQVHVLLSDDVNIGMYKEILKEYDNVIYEVVEYSYKELDDMVTKLVRKLEVDYDIIAYTVDIKMNKGMIYVQEKDYDDISELLKDENVIVQVSSKYRDEATVIGGAGITCNGYGFTLGGSGTYNGSTAFVTCGHMMSLNSTVKRNGSTIGTVKVNVHSSGNSGDYSIIKAAAGYTSTASVYTSSANTITFTGFWYHPGVGTYLYKYGDSTGQSYCQVTHYQITVNGITGLVGAKIINGGSSSGDSGGPYRQGQNFCGVHMGSSTSGGITSVFFTPYSTLHGAGFTIKTY